MRGKDRMLRHPNHCGETLVEWDGLFDVRYSPQIARLLSPIIRLTVVILQGKLSIELFRGPKDGILDPKVGDYCNSSPGIYTFRSQGSL